MSENVRFYKQKMVEGRARRPRVRSLASQLRDILAVVEDCERRWALEQRIEKQF